MKSKISLLISASILGLVALSVIQGYLINNTYELRKDAFMERTSEAVTVIDDHLTIVDSMRSEWRDSMVEIAAEYKQGLIIRDSILDNFARKTEEMNPHFIKIVREELKDLDVYENLKFRKKVRSIVLLDSLKNDTLYHNAASPKLYSLGENFDGEGYEISSSTSYSEYTFTKMLDEREVSETVRLNFETETEIDIDGWERGVLAQMKGLLIASILIFLFVFGLLFYSIKNLITQKKIAEVKTDFINNISHEFKTPLATLTLATGILKEEAKSGASSNTNTVSIVERQNVRLQKLLNQVLDNSLSYNEFTLKKECISAKRFLTDVLNDFKLSLSGDGVALIADPNLPEQEILIDRFYLTTALFNILENAVKYGESNVKVNVSAILTYCFTIEIQDNGMGISEQDQHHLFEKFFRAGNKEIHNVKGLGLGLFYADQVVKAHGGSIKVRSKLGQGSTFTIELPLNL